MYGRILTLGVGLWLLTACSSSSDTSTGGHGATGGAGGMGGMQSTGTMGGMGGDSAGGGGAGGESFGVGGGCTSVPTFAKVLSKPLSSCSGLEPPCHNASAGELKIDPKDPDLSWGVLVDVDSTIKNAGKRVVPGDAAKSFLYRKLIDDLGPKEGNPMPHSGLATGWNKLPDDQIEMVQCWILGGAKKD